MTITELQDYAWDLLYPYIAKGITGDWEVDSTSFSISNRMISIQYRMFTNDHIEFNLFSDLKLVKYDPRLIKDIHINELKSNIDSLCDNDDFIIKSKIKSLKKKIEHLTDELNQLEKNQKKQKR